MNQTNWLYLERKPRMDPINDSAPLNNLIYDNTINGMKLKILIRNFLYIKYDYVPSEIYNIPGNYPIGRSNLKSI